MQNFLMKFLVTDLCMEYILPLHIFMANSIKTISIPTYFVPKGGLVTTISTDLGLQFNYLISALMSSNEAPSTFSCKTSFAWLIYFWSNSNPTACLPKWIISVLCSDINHATNEHSSTNSNICDDTCFKSRLILINIEHKFSS